MLYSRFNVFSRVIYNIFIYKCEVKIMKTILIIPYVVCSVVFKVCFVSHLSNRVQLSLNTDIVLVEVCTLVVS